MQLNLKTVILLSALLAVVLNIWQFASSFQQRKDAFAPAWAYAQEAPNSTPSPAVRAALTTLPSDSSPSKTDPASVAGVTARLARAGLRTDHAALYLSVQQQTGTPWQLLAAVHKIETGQRGSTTVSSSAGAQGPMQFMPATFRYYAADGDGDGTRDIHDLEDSMLAAGRYLAANGASHGKYSNALFRYNHSWSYVSKVQAITARLGL